MSSELVIGILFASLAVFFLIGQWTAFALGAVGMLIIFLTKGWIGMLGLSSVVWNNSNSYILIAIPMFLLMGEIILRSGSSQNFYADIVKLLRKIDRKSVV